MTTSPFLTAKADILNWLATYCRTDGEFHIMEDGVVNVDGKLKLSAEGQHSLDALAVRFGYVKGDCNFSRCERLQSLIGSPHTVFGDFDCSYNEGLRHLHGSPVTVGGSYTISKCANIESLEGSPVSVGKAYKMEGCSLLRTLNRISPNIGIYIQCSDCTLLQDLLDSPNVTSIIAYRCPNLQLKVNSKIGEICASRFNKPAPDDFRTIMLNQTKISINHKLQSKWLDILRDYQKTDDLLTAIAAFEKYYKEPFQKAPSAEPTLVEELHCL